MPENHPYEMTLTLNVLNHLGLQLYSNVPAVLAEAVANSWDADAEWVKVDIEPREERITITDNGKGMTQEEINEKFLKVGYQRRQDEGEVTPKHGRKVMGRKGIGKLSLFSIAKTIEVFTTREGEQSALRMNVDDIEEKIRAEEETANGGVDGGNEEGEADAADEDDEGAEKEEKGTYYPEPLGYFPDDLQEGTRIVLTNLKKRVYQAEGALRKRLARRFGLKAREKNFTIIVNGDPIRVTDRDYFHKLQAIVTYGEDEEGHEEYVGFCNSEKLKEDEPAEGKTPDLGYQVEGWLGLVESSSDLKGEAENLNRVVLMMRGKLAEEDLLEHFTEGGLWSKYVMGEIHADFLDDTEKPDIATSNRQSIIEDDARFQDLLEFLRGEFRRLERVFRQVREKEGVRKAREIEEVRSWYESLPGDKRDQAKSLFGTINQMTVDSEEDRRRLFLHGVLAFESLRYKQQLSLLERVSPENVEEVTEVFGNLDEIEATLYHQIVTERLEVIKTLREKVHEDAREKVIQNHIFEHLWLLDPSWERATEEPYMEQNVNQRFEEIEADLTDEERRGRVDIKYKTVPGKHVIVELKRANRTLHDYKLVAQVNKYRRALQKLLEKAGRGHEPVEVVCVVGEPLVEWEDEQTRAESTQMLAAKGISVVLYDELLENAYRTYEKYFEKKREANRLLDILNKLETQGLYGE